jgi:hypothetical protein
VKPLRLFFVVLALLLAACGGSGGDDITTIAGSGDDATTTTSGDDGGGGGSIDIDDIPRECLDAFGNFLRTIEPAVEDFDFDNANLADLQQLSTELEPLTAEYEGTIGDADCDELDLDASDEEAFEFMIDFAEDEAPGTVAYFEWIRDFAIGAGGGLGDDDGGTATGDCDQDLAAFMEYVESGTTMNDLPLADLTTVGQLMTSISTGCPAATVAELFQDPEVSAFLESGG